MPTAAIKGRSFSPQFAKSSGKSTWRSSSAPISQRALRSCPSDGSSNAPSPGSTAAAVWPRIGSASTERPWRSCASPQSASCCESSVKKHHDPGQTLMTYGELHRVSDFIERIVGIRALSTNGFVLHTIAFLKALDRVQDKNPSVTLAIHTGDGVWVYYRGEKLLFVKPGKQFLNLHVFEPLGSTQAKRQLINFIRSKRECPDPLPS